MSDGYPVQILNITPGDATHGQYDQLLFYIMKFSTGSNKIRQKKREIELKKKPLAASMTIENGQEYFGEWYMINLLPVKAKDLGIHCQYLDATSTMWNNSIPLVR